MPIDYVKIDRSFIADLAEDSSDRNLVDAIIIMCHKLGMQVVAEGVETLVQRKLLEEMGCDYMQGYLFGRPEPASHLFSSVGRGIPGEFLRGLAGDCKTTAADHLLRCASKGEGPFRSLLVGILMY